MTGMKSKDLYAALRPASRKKLKGVLKQAHKLKKRGIEHETRVPLEFKATRKKMK